MIRWIGIVAATVFLSACGGTAADCEALSLQCERCVDMGAAGSCRAIVNANDGALCATKISEFSTAGANCMPPAIPDAGLGDTSSDASNDDSGPDANASDASDDAASDAGDSDASNSDATDAATDAPGDTSADA